MANAKNTSSSSQHHYLRTVAASCCGALAMLLVSASVLVVWADRTLTDTPAFVQAVGPVIERPAVQTYVADQVSGQLLNAAPITDLAQALLPPNQIAGKTQQQLQAALKSALRANVLLILTSPAVQAAWRQTSQGAHIEFMRELNANAPELRIDLGPFVHAVLVQLTQTKLASIANQIKLKPSASTIIIKDKAPQKIHTAYHWLKTGAPIVVLLALLFASLSVWASVHHVKTFRRMLITVSVSTLAVAAAIALPQTMRSGPGSDLGAGSVAIALTATLLHGLQIECVILGVVCFVLAVGSKLYELRPRA